jgi:hypothetical protein
VCAVEGAIVGANIAKGKFGGGRQSQHKEISWFHLP